MGSELYSLFLEALKKHYRGKSIPFELYCCANDSVVWTVGIRVDGIVYMSQTCKTPEEALQHLAERWIATVCPLDPITRLNTWLCSKVK